MSDRAFNKQGPFTALPGKPAKLIESHILMPGETVVLEGGEAASRKFSRNYKAGGEQQELTGLGLSDRLMNPY